MAWTNLTYSVGQILTAAQMTALFDNFAAMAGKLSGSPTVLGANFTILQPFTAYSAVSSIPLTSLTSADYDYYYIFVHGLFPASNNTQVQFEVSDDNGSSWKTANYAYNQARIAGALTQLGSGSAGEIPLAGDLGNAASGSARGLIRIMNPLGTANRKGIWTEFMYNQAVAAQFGASTWDGGDGALNAFRFVQEAGGNLSGNVAVVGVYGL